MFNEITKIFSFMAAFVVLVIADASYAASLNSAATITVLKPITIQENVQLNFGTIQTPTDPTETVIVTTAGADGGGTATFINSSALAAGDLTVTSSAVAISLSASDAGGATGMSFTAFTGAFNGGGSADLGAGISVTGVIAGATLLVGATLSVANTVADGTHAPSFNLDVNYE